MAKVHFAPIDEEIEVGDEETVLDAAFRQGYSLAYGCREGQCSACKSYLLEGEVSLKPYSSFALSDTEESQGYTLLCRAMPDTDLSVELLHVDEDYKLENPIVEGKARVTAVQSLTHDIHRLEIEVTEPADFAFLAGQYLDLTVPEREVTRAFSIASLPGSQRLEFTIKRYPGGRFSGLLEDELKAGDELRFVGPYGQFHLRQSQRPIVMVAGGSGMGPQIGLLRSMAGIDPDQPVRFYYGARTERDLFYREEIEQLGAGLKDFAYVPVLSEAEWDGETGLVHEVAGRLVGEEGFDDFDAYLCGPPPMVESAIELFAGAHGIDRGHIHYDKFTTAAEAGGEGGGEAPAADAFSAPDAGQTDPKAARETGAGPGEPAPAEEPPGDGRARSSDGRQFSYFEPAGRRATLYEDVTVDTQPSPGRHLDRGWFVGFADGRDTWDQRSTAVRHEDWFAFRDPNEMWERPFYQQEAGYERQIEDAVALARHDRQWQRLDPAWIEFLRAHMQQTAFIEQGMWLVLASSARACLSDSISHWVAFQAGMKQRAAQAVVLYAMDLEEDLGEFSMDAARQSFMDDEHWQPTRRFVEKCNTIVDWGEAVVAINVCFEPLIGVLLRRELLERGAAANHDTTTPVVFNVAQSEWAKIQRFTAEFLRFVLASEGHEDENRKVVQGWLDEWLPMARESALALGPLFSAAPVPIDVEQAVATVESELAESLEALGLNPRGDAPPARRPEPHFSQRVVVAAPERPEAADRPTEERPVRAPDEPGDGDSGTYDFVGIVMSKSAEGDALADVMRDKEGVQVIENASFWDIRARDRLVIDFEEVSEEIGFDINASSIQHEMSTVYGRQVNTDEKMMLFSDPEEAMEYLSG